MAKSPMSITIDSNLIEQLKYLAGLDNRTLSNYIENVLRSHVESRGREVAIAQSYEKAKKIAAGMRIGTFSEVNNELMQNVHLTDADKHVLDAIKEK